MNTLIVGGTSGLGLALAEQLTAAGQEVFVTGRQAPQLKSAKFVELDLNSPNLPQTVNKLMAQLPKIDQLIYAAGFWQQAPITELSDEQIENKLNIGARGIIYAVREVLKKQRTLETLVVVTSMSQWSPSKQEPLYNFIKAGAGNFAKGLVKDGQIGKILVVAPANMQESGWDGQQNDEVDNLLDKGWVAKQIIDQLAQIDKFKSIKILQNPARVEVAETD